MAAPKMRLGDLANFSEEAGLDAACIDMNNVRLNASVNVGDFRTGTAAIFKAVWSNTTKQEAADDGEGRKKVR
jgi:hypothetical protein